MDISKIFAPLIGVVVGFLLSEWKGRKTKYEEKRNKSLLGVAVVEGLLEEVINGYEILLKAKQDNRSYHLLPNKTWYGMQTINDDVVLRIIAVSSGVKARGFPPREIRTHCKNYFEHIVGQFNDLVNSGKPLKPLFNGNFDEATKGVLDMLQQTKELLEQDAISRKPKG